jgi:hypothetical protein
VLLSILLYGLPGAFIGVWIYEFAFWWAQLPDDDSKLDEANPTFEKVENTLENLSRAG